MPRSSSSRTRTSTPRRAARSSPSSATPGRRASAPTASMSIRPSSTRSSRRSRHWCAAAHGRRRDRRRRADRPTHRRGGGPQSGDACSGRGEVRRRPPLVGGNRPTHLPRGNFYAPTLLDRATDSMRVMREETFGPVAPVARFENEAEVLRRANAGPVRARGLSLHQRPLARVARRRTPRIRDRRGQRPAPLRRPGAVRRIQGIRPGPRRRHRRDGRIPGNEIHQYGGEGAVARDQGSLIPSSATARWAWSIAEFAYALAPASEFAIVIRPNGWRAITHGRSCPGGGGGSEYGSYSYA